MSEPAAVFRLTCPHCKKVFTVKSPRSELKQIIKDIDREARKTRKQIKAKPPRVNGEKNTTNNGGNLP